MDILPLSTKESCRINDSLKIQDFYPLTNLFRMIFIKLNLIKSESSNGSVIDEIIERTEIMALKIQRGQQFFPSFEELKDYQKNLCQQLRKLHQSELKEGYESDFKGYKESFYYLFKYMDKVFNSLNNENTKSLSSASPLSIRYD